MSGLRANPPKEIGGKKVLYVRDYKTSERISVETGEKEKITLPKSDVIYLELADNNIFVVRPSGTEPKIKLYCLLSGKDLEDTTHLFEEVKKDIDKIVK